MWFRREETVGFGRKVPGRDAAVLCQFPIYRGSRAVVIFESLAEAARIGIPKLQRQLFDPAICVR